MEDSSKKIIVSIVLNPEEDGSAQKEMVTEETIQEMEIAPTLLKLAEIDMNWNGSDQPQPLETNAASSVVQCRFCCRKVPSTQEQIFGSYQNKIRNYMEYVLVTDLQEELPFCCCDCLRNFEQFYDFKTSCLAALQRMENQNNEHHDPLDLEIGKPAKRSEKKKTHFCRRCGKGFVLLAFLLQHQENCNAKGSKAPVTLQLPSHNAGEKLQKNIKRKSTTNTVKSEPEIKVIKEQTETDQDSERCNQQFEDKKDFQTEWLTHVKADTSNEDTVFPDNPTLSDVDGSEIETTVCGSCGRNFVSPEILIRHKGFCSKQSRLVEVKKVKREKRYRRVDHRERFPIAVSVECFSCGALFDSTDALREHILKHEKPVYQCETCGKICTTNYLLKKHHAMQHNNEKFLCQICGKQFLSEQAVAAHTAIHEREIKCKICDEKLETAQLLRKHMFERHRPARVKTEVKPALCILCGKQLKSPRALRYHMVKFHPEGDVA